MSWVFANSSGNRGSILGRVIPKTQNMVLDASLFNTQQYKVRVKWNNSGKELCPPLLLGAVATEKGAFGSPSTQVANFTYFYKLSCIPSWY